nr:ribonuclease H-like domain-containing protein [Tanacetum cinerariifolium]
TKVAGLCGGSDGKIIGVVGYGGVGQKSREIELQAELYSLKLRDLRINAYFRKIKFIAIILTSLGSPISKDDVAVIALEGFPDKYENVSGFHNRRVLLRYDSTGYLHLVMKPSLIPHAFLTSQLHGTNDLDIQERKYATKILKQAHMAGCNPCRTSVGTNSKLGADGDPDLTLYSSLAGDLQYLTFTRLDNPYAIQ